MNKSESGVVCLICNKEYINIRSLSIHIRKSHKMSTKEYYDKFLKTENEGKCLVCGKSTTYMYLSTGYKLGCSYRCSGIIGYEKTKNRCQKLYGKDHFLQVDLIRQKIINTVSNRYGKSNYLQTDDFKRKSKVTWLDNYGVDNPQKSYSVKTKTKNIIISKYGVPTLHLNEKIRQKFTNTMMERYGTRHALQNMDLFEKHSKHMYLWKDYVLPSGKIIKLQGYEHKFLDCIFTYKLYDEDDIIPHPKIRFKYIRDGSERFYFPDFLIKSINEIVEVKSWYTLELDINIQLKCNSVIDNDYGFRLFYTINE